MATNIIVPDHMDDLGAYVLESLKLIETKAIADADPEEVKDAANFALGLRNELRRMATPSDDGDLVVRLSEAVDVLAAGVTRVDVKLSGIKLSRADRLDLDNAFRCVREAQTVLVRILERHS